MPMRTLLYRYRLTQFEITADNQQQAQLLLDGEIKQEGTTTVCTTPESSRLLQSGVTMRYDYYDMSMAYVGTFSVKWSDCQQRR